MYLVVVVVLVVIVVVVVVLRVVVVHMNVLLQVPLHGSFRDAFRNVRSVLVDRLDVSHGLIDILCRDDILTEQHASDIRVSNLVDL